MKNKIKDTDVSAFVDAAREELGLATLMIWCSGISKPHFSGTTDYIRNLDANSIEELKQKLAEDTPEAHKRKELEEAKARVAELKEELGGES